MDWSNRTPATLVLVCLGCNVLGAEDDPRVLSARDTLRINQVGSPTLSPDGEWVLYTLRSRDMESDDLKATTQIWRVRIDGSNNHQLTRGTEGARSPAWSPHGKMIGFLASRGEGRGEEKPKAQVYFMYAGGGEAWQVTDHETSVSYFSLSSDGKSLAFQAEDALSKEEKAKKEKKDDTEVVDEKHQMTHLWIQDRESKEERRLTEGDFSVIAAEWSPDSRRIAFVTRPSPKANDNWNSDIWVVAVKSGEKRKLYDNPGSDSSPRWSPDGTTIAFSANSRPRAYALHQKLYLVPSKGGEPRVLLQDFDNNFGTPIWARDDQSILWGAGEKTASVLYSVDLGTEVVEKLATPRGRNSAWELSKNGKRWVWVHTGSTRPGEVYTADRQFQNITKLTDANAWTGEEKVQWGAVETVSWKNSSGQTIEGVLTYPVNYRESQTYPFILNPHGGPTGAVLEAFSSTNQFFSGNGYFVLQPNFRGSTNYGQDFVNANYRNWGVTDYDDSMTGVDYAIEQGWGDPERLICYGWSYGGYMSFWISTRTNRFKVVSPGAGLSNLYSMYSTTDIPDYLASFFGRPWDVEDIYRKHSPIRHVKKVESAILIMHGAEDVRVPPEQAVEFYQALKDLGKDVTFVRFPREGHGIQEPRHAMDRLRRYAYFFGKYVSKPPISEKAWEEELENQENSESSLDETGHSGRLADRGIFEVIQQRSWF